MIRDDVFEKLRGYGIPFDALEHAPVATMEDCMPGAKQLNACMPKNLFLTPRNQSSYTLVIVPPFAPFRTADISKQLGLSRLSFASAEKMEELLHTLPGAASPLGLLFDTEHRVRFAMDRALLKEERLAFHPCVNTCTVAMQTRDFLHLLALLGRESETVETQNDPVDLQ